jgi:hypothetical protein
LAFSPFGFAHFSKGKTLKGSLIASGQVALLALNIGAYSGKQSYLLPGSQGVADAHALQAYNALQGVQFGALLLLAGLYAYSVIDAFLSE